jgi:hypothetical protein
MQPTNSGTVMLAALPVLLGIQMMLSALLYVVSAVPTNPIYPSLGNLLGDEKLFLGRSSQNGKTDCDPSADA